MEEENIDKYNILPAENTKDIIFYLNNKEKLRMTPNGFYVDGKLISDDKEMYDSFKKFLFLSDSIHTKSEKWDKLGEKISNCYGHMDNNGVWRENPDTEEFDLCAIGELAATAYGWI